MPSPCAALTSAPSFNSFFTAAASFACAAAAMSAGPAALSDAAIVAATMNASALVSFFILSNRRFWSLVQIHHRRAVAERFELEADAAQRAEHRVRHRRAV